MVDPLTDEVYIESGELITEEIANRIDASPIEVVEVRSPLTCATKRGICEKCDGTNLVNKGAQQGDSVGVIAAQSIGEPGTQLTLRTFTLEVLRVTYQKKIKSRLSLTVKSN